MKTFTILLLSTIIALTITFFITPALFAFDVPPDAIIKVYNKDGKQIGEMTRKNFKVVKIEEKLPAPILEPVIMYVTKTIKEKSNTFTFHGGMGQNGLKLKEYNHDKYTIQTKYNPIFGGTLCTETDFCFTALTNKTYLMGVRFNLD